MLCVGDIFSGPFEDLALATIAYRFIDDQHEGDPDYDALRLRVSAVAVALGVTWTSGESRLIDEAFKLRAQLLRSLEYSDYLKTEHWQTVRAGARHRAQGKCQLCSSPRHLHVHHRTYGDLGNEGPEDVTVLCAGCHRTFHEHRQLAR